MTVSSDEAIAAWQANISTVRSLVQERQIYQAAADHLSGEGADVVTFTVTSAVGTPVNVPIGDPLDEEALALVTNAVSTRLTEIAASLLELGIVDE
jgi:hypothetical protein